MAHNNLYWWQYLHQKKGQIFIYVILYSSFKNVHEDALSSNNPTEVPYVSLVHKFINTLHGLCISRWKYYLESPLIWSICSWVVRVIWFDLIWFGLYYLCIVCCHGYFCLLLQTAQNGLCCQVGGIEMKSNQLK